VRELPDSDARAGINRVVWDLSWTPPASPGGGGRGGRGGGGGIPAAPGRYTATLAAAGQTKTAQFDVRGDPNVGATAADYEARIAAGRRAMRLQEQLGEMIGAMTDLTGQVDATLEAIDGKGLPNADAIRAKAGEAKDRLRKLGNETNRPPTGMGYRDWPRLLEQLRFVAGGINGAQARPTAGQLEVLTLVEQATAQRATELTAIIDTAIAELNAMLKDQPKILSSWKGGRITS
jgi:hypothetical protein